MRAGLLLLSGGTGRRMGRTKHDLPHPRGGSWGGHLVALFRRIFPQGPIQILGAPLPDHPELSVLADPQQGPAVALRLWAAQPAPEADRWWVVACDQVRWDADQLRQWAEACEQADPGAGHWVVAQHDGRLQPLGGWLPAGLRAPLADLAAPSLLGLLDALPHCVLVREEDAWRDLDTPEDLREWRG